jgi:hypothetical protein
MGDRSVGSIVPKARYQSAIDDLDNGSFRLGRGVGSLIQKAPHARANILLFRASFVAKCKTRAL